MRTMAKDCTLSEADHEMLYCEISDEALEIQARRETATGNITLYYCTALYFCPGP